LQKKTESKERKVEDIAIVNELCKITGTNKQTVKNVTRLGKKDVDSDNPRPMRVFLFFVTFLFLSCHGLYLAA
jgi:hypothetical protein